MGKKYLIDTNIISHLFSNKISDQGKKFVQEIINTNFIISVVIEIEVLTYHESPQLMPLIEEFVNLAVVLPLTKEIAKKSIELRRNSRNNKKLKFG